MKFWKKIWRDVLHVHTSISILNGKSRVGRSTSRSASQAKLGNLFDDFKREILSNLTKQVEMLRIKNEKKMMFV